MANNATSSSFPTPTVIDVSRRLRRAILRNDLLLVKRIVRANPESLRNPDFEDKSNTSLHLASKEGWLEIVEFLVEAGHEDSGVSKNTDWDTPLMVACTNARVEVGQILIEHFPRCIPWTNKTGMDALMLSARHGALPLLPLLLTNDPPASPAAHDSDGNTALHHASAAGELKACRVLLQYGASPVAQNAYSWTPIHYSATNAAEMYFKALVQEFEKRRVEQGRMEKERERQKAAGVRLVTDDSVTAPNAVSGDVVNMSPVVRTKTMTPTAGRAEWPIPLDMARARSSSGD